MNPLAAAIAFLCFGALLTGSMVMLLLNPRSRSVRWWVAFQAANLVWLGAQGWAAATANWSGLGWVVVGTVHMMAALFLAFALVDGYSRPDRDALLAVGLGLVTLPIYTLPGGAGWLIAAWHIGVWGTASLVLARGHRHKSWPQGVDRRLAIIVRTLIFVIAPVSLVGWILLGNRMWFYAMPLLVVWIQFLIFIGVVHLRFYDIEVRAARTGELAAAAAEQERLAVLGELSASLAHEIRNPLTGVRSLAQRLADDQVDEERRRRYAGIILEEVGRVERLVSNLLGIARRNPPVVPQGGSTPLDTLFADLLLLLGSRAEKAGVRLAIDAGEIHAAAPRELLAQALLNLLLNAVAHAPRDSSVTLLAREAGSSTEILVRDAGPGVPPDERERIWEPFQSGGSGTGLGLAVVRRLAREQGWEVQVGDSPAGGAEFRLRVPGAPTMAAGSGRLASNHTTGIGASA
jgi:signal transduction histidine kinase